MNQPPVEPPSGPASPSEPTAEHGDGRDEVCLDEWFERPEPTDVELYGLCPDPFAGPPDDADAWLADLTSAELEVLYCNPPDIFSTRDEQPVGTGFAAGAWLDQLIPGPVLSSFSQDAMDSGLGSLGDDELVGLLRAARRLASWQAAVEFRAVGELDGRRKRESGRPGWSQVSEHISCELAAALTLTGRSADSLLCLSRDLARLPMVLRALAEGRIDRARAEIFATELAALDDVAAAKIANALCDIAGSMTTSRLRYALRRMVLAVDPSGARRRAAKARQDARVEAWSESSGNAALAGRELPSADAIAADRRIAAIARALKEAGASGTMDQLRAAVFVALLTGRDPEPLQTADEEAESRQKLDRVTPANSVAQSCQGSIGSADTSRGDLPSQGDRLWWLGPGLGGSVNLTMPLTTWLGESDAPGDVAGRGPVDAYTSRELAERIRHGPDARWCVTLTGRDGRAVAHACGGAGPGPLSKRPARTGPDPPGTDRAWLGKLKFERINAGACDHEHKALGYRPGHLLRTLTKVRDRTCRFPGCRRPAVACDDDHTVPYDQGGMTCECNLASLCRRHHQAKQTPGWTLAQRRPGQLIWTTPHGRTYETRPDAYPT